jgi:lauroyl/myristoyl acyltransferase
MEILLYCLALGLVHSLQALPLTLVAWVGRRVGGMAYYVDGRHRRVARENLTLAFQDEKNPKELRALAREHFRRLGENYACAIKTASMKPAALARHVQFVGTRPFLPPSEYDLPRSRLFALGHFGNFELYARAGQFVPGYKGVTTYRSLPQPRLNGLLLSLRRQSGCLFFERRTQGVEFLKKLTQPGLCVGLLSDQHAGQGGIGLPFLGRECSTLTAPAILAQRYKMPLHTAICFRTGLARWRVEMGDEIATCQDGHRRPVADIMREVNQAFELAIRRDPANWFWVHRRWKPLPPKSRSPA